MHAFVEKRRLLGDWCWPAVFGQLPGRRYPSGHLAGPGRVSVLSLKTSVYFYILTKIH